MVTAQLKILSGTRAGATFLARQFPCAIGRAAAAQLRLEDPGVWDQHVQLDLAPDAGFVLRLQGGALATCNTEPFQTVALRNGDVIALGAVKLQFWLGEVEQSNPAGRELAVWLALAALTAGQIALAWWLVR